MLLPEFDAVAAEVALRVRAVLAADLDATLVPDLLAAVDVMSALARRVGLTACQTFADVRVEQALANREPCPGEDARTFITRSGRLRVATATPGLSHRSPRRARSRVRCRHDPRGDRRAGAGRDRAVAEAHAETKRKMWRWEEAKVGLVQVPGRQDRLYAVHPTGGLDESFADLSGLAVLEGWSPTTAESRLRSGGLRPRHAGARRCRLRGVPRPWLGHREQRGRERPSPHRPGSTRDLRRPVAPGPRRPHPGPPEARTPPRPHPMFPTPSTSGTGGSRLELVTQRASLAPIGGPTA